MNCGGEKDIVGVLHEYDGHIQSFTSASVIETILQSKGDTVLETMKNSQILQIIFHSWK